MENTTFNAEFAQCRFRYNALKEQVANAIETYSHLVDTQGPNIETQYMMLVGQYEIHAMRLEIEVKRWKRRITLRQNVTPRQHGVGVERACGIKSRHELIRTRPRKAAGLSRRRTRTIRFFKASEHNPHEHPLS